MKMKSQNKWLILTTILMFLLVTAYGVIGSWQNAKSITEGYKTGITLKETVVLDNERIIAQYGEPVTLEAGTEGEISDVIDQYTEKHEYKHIRASFPLDEGEKISVIWGYEMESGKDTDIIVDTYDARINILDDEKDQGNSFEVATPVININKINDSQKLASEFLQAREKYYQAVKQTRIKGSVLGAIAALAMVAGVWLVKHIVRKEKVGKVLLILTICIDVVLVLVDLISFYLIKAM